jgi:hypothetical protein
MKFIILTGENTVNWFFHFIIFILIQLIAYFGSDAIIYCKK